MKKIVLITGATAGIGEATAHLLAQNNFNLIITGRRNERLNGLKEKIENETEAKVFALNFDIRSKPETEKAFESLPESWKNIDILINNAGLAAGLSRIDNGDTDDWERMIDTNIKGLLYITQLVSAKMIERKEGHIVNISSIAGKETYPMGNVYCATKHAVQALTKGMRIDFLKYGIKVSSVAPGAVDTEFSLVRFKGDEQRAKSVYEGFTPLFAQDIAETILFVVTRPKHLNIDDILVMPTDQAFSRDFNREKG
ncbi:SDR family NAD(P)-dependent oxidoreductase [Mariniphaga sp.]|uniref:SDR family NAD(P)-dependent oxidoreductase n=1 Tax=Mariniphaga sp. TaxID=1954475 RepID=UPI00356B1B00